MNQMHSHQYMNTKKITADRIEMMKSLTDQQLLHIRAQLEKTQDVNGCSGVRDHKADDLFDDVDFELAVRGIK